MVENMIWLQLLLIILTILLLKKLTELLQSDKKFSKKEKVSIILMLALTITIEVFLILN